jgi:hypothetical protein
LEPPTQSATNTTTPQNAACVAISHRGRAGSAFCCF